MHRRVKISHSQILEFMTTLGNKLEMAVALSNWKCSYLYYFCKKNEKVKENCVWVSLLSQHRWLSFAEDE